MDIQTITAYNQDADKIAALHSTLIPHKLYQQIQQHFIKQGQTADIGCGIGRDSFYLQQQGYMVTGVDASVAMLAQARELYPSLNLHQDYLPDLTTLSENSFDNILCSAVLMHLNKQDVEKACFRLLALLKTNGILIITLRGTHQADKRENGKLYEEIDIKELCQLFQQHYANVVEHEIDHEPKRQLIWHNLVIKKRLKVIT